jgi:hypothetical protein
VPGLGDDLRRGVRRDGDDVLRHVRRQRLPEYVQSDADDVQVRLRVDVHHLHERRGLRFAR